MPAALGEPDSGKSTACKVALAATGGWKKNFFASVSEKVRNNYPSLESLFKYITLSFVPCLYSSIDITTSALLKVLFFTLDVHGKNSAQILTVKLYINLSTLLYL